MIVKDEERTLERCLKAAKPLVDDIIIADTGSTDRTVEIARQMGAAVYPFTWVDDLLGSTYVFGRHRWSLSRNRYSRLLSVST